MQIRAPDKPQQSGAEPCRPTESRTHGIPGGSDGPATRLTSSLVDSGTRAARWQTEEMKLISFDCAR